MNTWTQWMINLDDNMQLELTANYRLGEMQFVIYNNDTGEQTHGTTKMKQFIEFANTVLKMEDDCQ